MRSGLGFVVGWWPVATSIAQVLDPAPPTPTVVWDSETGSGATVAVRAFALADAAVAAMKSTAGTDPRWSGILTIHVANEDGSIPLDRPAILGVYRVEGKMLRFTPRFPLDPNRRYSATFDPDGPSGPAQPNIVARSVLVRPPMARPLVERIEPIGDLVPENLLKFYLYFNAPMGRGEAYSHLQLVDAEGKPLDHPFLEIGEELWDPTNTRLMVLLDPGRIKRGLRPHEELGPIFVVGRSYTLKVNPAWRAAGGQSLGAPSAKTFRAGPADEVSPTPKAWAITAPQPSTTEPLVVRFADTLDRATVASGLTLLGPGGPEVAGKAEVTLDGSVWKFSPDHPWVAGVYELAVDTDLEDLAGNSVRRPFEVDVQRDVPMTAEVSVVRLPITIH